MYMNVNNCIARKKGCRNRFVNENRTDGLILHATDGSDPSKEMPTKFPTTTLLKKIGVHCGNYHEKRSFLEMKNDDKEFKIMISQWDKADAGNGWTGPTYFERWRRDVNI